MPCEIRDDDEVPIARYGSLAPGPGEVHLPARTEDPLWRHDAGHLGCAFQLLAAGGVLAAVCGVLPEPRRRPGYSRSASYFELLRNYRRHGWIVSYLFGVSPALCRSFLQGRKRSGLSALGADTLIGPYATSLRMSDIGYRNRNQAAVAVSVNSLEEYLRDLRRAIRAAASHRSRRSASSVDGEYQQLSGNVLQIENEYYSYIRPKRTPRAGERTTQALARAGVEYVEVRALDNSAFDRVGVNPRKLYFLEALADRAAAQGQSADRCQ